MSLSADQAWQSIQGRVRELEALSGAMGVLEWDQQVWMPRGGAEYRGQQQALLQGLAHERVAAPEVGDWLGALRADAGTAADPVRRAALRNLGRSHARAVQVPADLVRAMAEASSRGFADWMTAREADDFAPFAASLTELVRLQRQKVACFAPAAHPYDHLVGEYDPGATTADLRALFVRLEEHLAGFVQAATTSGVAPAALNLEVPVEAQRRLSMRIIKALGFDLGCGRLDESEHPFSMGIGPKDVRLTTHYKPSDLLSSLGGTIHECGHGMYEQGLPEAMAGTTLRAAAGFGLHESQSRFWENMIGRSQAFCEWLAPMVREEVPGSTVSADQLYGAANCVRASLIRIEADEATYNLHILVRFQLETALLEGALEVADLPAAWDAAYQRLLGVRAPSPKKGVLQDVHWSAGLFGYFPSYTIGNLYAAGFTRAMEAALPGMWTQVERGEFQDILGWLRTHVHQRGHEVDPPQVYSDAAGPGDPVDDLMAHLRRRHGALHGL